MGKHGEGRYSPSLVIAKSTKTRKALLKGDAEAGSLSVRALIEAAERCEKRWVFLCLRKRSRSSRRFRMRSVLVRKSWWRNSTRCSRLSFFITFLY